MIKRETVVAGNIISRRYYGAPERVPGEKRKKKQNPTAEAVAATNRRNSERELMIKLNHNFKPGDMLPYRGGTAEEGRRGTHVRDAPRSKAGKGLPRRP